MILKDKTQEFFGYSYCNARQLDKIPVRCDSCNKQYAKLKRDLITWNHKCLSCFAKERATELGNTYGKAQKVEGKCADCGTGIRSTRRRCRPCGSTFAKQRMIGNKNPAWTGKSICPECKGNKSLSAKRCRPCSFKLGFRSGEQNGRFIKKDRSYYLECKKSRMHLQGVMNNTCNSLGYKKNYKKTKDLLGYTWKEFKEHIESKFQDGMNWNNKGLWEIDHIIPVSWFVRNKIYDVKIVNSLNNLQPLWAKDNLKKRDAVDEIAAWAFIDSFNESK